MPEKLVRPGGIQSIVLTQQLIKTRKAFSDLLRKPGELQKFLKMQKIKNAQRVWFRSSRAFPGINFFIETKGEYPESGSADIVNIPNIGPVAVNFINKPKVRLADELFSLKSASRRLDRQLREHEQAHVHTRIIRHSPLRKLSKADPRFIKEKLLDELISRTAAGRGKELQNLSIMPLLDYIHSFATGKWVPRKKKPSNKAKQATEKQLGDALIKKLAAIDEALQEMPRGEVLIVLRQTSWGNLERDLQERISLRRKFLRR